jgi:UDP-N-acetylglucosamine/UDP-N-acetylgalactosamine diphosphorylase
VLPQAERWTVLSTPLAEEFAPVKNKDSEKVDTPYTAQRMMCDLAAKWLREAGVKVAADLKVEISPLFALDAEELRDKVKGRSPIDNDSYLG